MSSLVKTFQKGEVIIKEGHVSNSFYIIQEGRVEVVKQGKKREVHLSLLGPKDFFGEVCLLDPEVTKHSATIRAVEETKLIIMDKEDFDAYIGKLTPGARNLLRKLAVRLRETDWRIASMGSGDDDMEPDNTQEDKGSDSS